MQIFVDADACPVVRIVEEIAKKYCIPVTLFCDTNHVQYNVNGRDYKINETAKMKFIMTKTIQKRLLFIAMMV